MSKKTYNLVVGVLGGLSAIAGAVVDYLQIANTPAIIAAIVIANTAAVEICNLFVSSEKIEMLEQV